MSEPSSQEIRREVPSVYFNGYHMGMTNADVFVRLQLDGQTIMELKMSYTTAKTLSSGIADTVANLEATTGHVFMTQKEVMDKINAAAAAKATLKDREPETTDEPQV